ncbi:MAG: hypothetical protein HZA54_13560 [Planctomycetes bacterium]|nr:hypothetical protein [Planctomycetota bacterium]
MRETLVARMRRVQAEEQMARRARLSGTSVEELRTRDAADRRTAEESDRLRAALCDMMPALWAHPDARRLLERLAPKRGADAELADTLATVMRANAPALAREISKQIDVVAVAPGATAPAGAYAAAAPPPEPEREIRRIPIDDIQGIIDMLNEVQRSGAGRR